MNTDSIAQYFLLETYSRAEAVKGQCEHLLTHEYASEAPKNLANALIGLTIFFQEVTALMYNESKDDIAQSSLDELERILLPFKFLDNVIVETGKHVRFIDSARSQRVPWSIVPAFEDFADELLDDVEVMFCPLWEFNYQIFPKDFREIYFEWIDFFQSVPGVDTDKAKENINQSLRKPFHIIRFPSPDRLNIRLHANIGHELGHKLAAQFLTQDKKTALLKALLPEVNKIIDTDIKDGKAPGEPLLRAHIQQAYIEKLTKIWQCALEEILSDLTACILFGPAALFSMYDVVLKDKLDHLPNEDYEYYPPWRFRLRTAIELLENSTEKFFPIPIQVFQNSDTPENSDNLVKYYEHIKELTTSTSDLSLFNSDSLVDLVYSTIKPSIEEGVKFLLGNQYLKDLQLTPTKLYEKLPHLIERLENRIIPNAVEINAFNTSPANFGEIVNATWYYWLSLSQTVITEQGEFNRDSYRERTLMNNLALKAVEYAHLENKYNIECKEV